MNEIELKINASGQGAFIILENDERLAELRFGITNKILIAYHTEVSDKLKGQGVGKKLIEAMVAYVRQHEMKVVALCPFVNAQFRRNPELYADIWEKDYKALKQ